MQATLRLEGLAALVCHNERLADPLDPFVKEIAKYSKKRGKTEADHEEIGFLEFMGGLYCSPTLNYPLNGNNGVPSLPAWNILRCLQDGGRRHKRGMDVPRGIYPLVESVPIQYEGPTDPQEMWGHGGFMLRKSVGIQRSRTMRTRPFFAEWAAELPIEVDAQVFDLGALATIWHDAGIYAGLGEMRPVYGRFNGTLGEA